MKRMYVIVIFLLSASQCFKKIAGLYITVQTAFQANLMFCLTKQFHKALSDLDLSLLRPEVVTGVHNTKSRILNPGCSASFILLHQWCKCGEPTTIENRRHTNPGHQWLLVKMGACTLEFQSEYICEYLLLRKSKRKPTDFILCL